jgi:outer membrane protein
MGNSDTFTPGDGCLLEVTKYCRTISSCPHGGGCREHSRVPIVIYANVLLILGCALSAQSRAQSSSGRESRVDGEYINQHANCSLPDSTPLSLTDVMGLALCNSPKSRGSWAALRAQGLQLRVDLGAYLPTVSADGGIGLDHTGTSVPEVPFYDSNVKAQGRKAELKFNLVLLDFGQRAAKVEHDRALVAAAAASQDETFQEVLLNAGQTYYDTVDAIALLDSTKMVETISQDSYIVTKARYDAGAGVITDVLQAQTAYLQSKVKRETADGDSAIAHGNLALQIGLAADTFYTLRDPAGSDSVVDAELEPANVLIAAAEKANPKVVAAIAKLSAAEADIKAAVALGKPTIGLLAQVSRQEQLLRGENNLFSFTQTPASNVTRDRQVNLEFSIPVFNGFSHRYGIQQANAQAAASKAQLQDTKQQLDLEVWTAYQSVKTQTQKIRETAELLAVAHQSYNASLERYRVGSGSILDVLSAQSAVANADEQRIEAVSNWRIAKLKLAASLGDLGLWLTE